MSFAREVAIASELAREAAVLVEGFRSRTITVEHKAGNEPVTEADRKASELIVGRLATAFPGDAILSEEVPDDGSRLRASRVWMVDPIDGTRDFIDGEAGYAVMIGLCVDGRPQVGVVCHPPTGFIHAGIVGVGAWKELIDGTRHPLTTTGLASPPGIRLVASKSHRTDEIDRFRKALGIVDEINVGGVGLKVGLVADASRDLYVYPGSRTKIWDTCAPEAILLAAGGRITDTTGQLLSYASPQLGNLRGIVASNGPLHDMVIRTLADLKLGRR